MNKYIIKVLLIEDNEIDARLIKEYLKNASRYEENETYHIIFDLTMKNSLSSGLEFLSANDVDAVLLDLNLPDSVGLDTFFNIYKNISKVPILILTGLSDREMAVKAVREGAGDYLVKGEVDDRLIRRSISYAISHDLILPLVTIKGFLGYLQKDIFSLFYHWE